MSVTRAARTRYSTRRVQPRRVRRPWPTIGFDRGATGARDPLVVEDVRKVPNFDWLTQIVVKLPDSIDLQGDYRISLTFRGTTGNNAAIGIIR